MKWSIYAPNPTQFSTSEMFFLEKSVSQFFYNQIRSSPTFANQEVYMTNFDVKEQEVNKAAVYTVLRGEMSVLYGGTKQDNFAASLSKVVTNERAQNLLETLVSSGYFESSSMSSKIYFEDVESLTIVSTTNNEILFICLIALVGVLIMTSFSILLSSVNCRRRSIDEDQIQGIKPSNTMETAVNSPGNSPGKLGARRNVAPDDTESAYAITPVRCVSDPHRETPGSQISYRTEASNASRNPLGIMRLNTLNKVALEPGKAKETKSMYQITLHESDDEESAYEK